MLLLSMVVSVSSFFRTVVLMLSCHFNSARPHQGASCSNTIVVITGLLVVARAVLLMLVEPLLSK